MLLYNAILQFANSSESSKSSRQRGTKNKSQNRARARQPRQPRVKNRRHSSEHSRPRADAGIRYAESQFNRLLANTHVHSTSIYLVWRTNQLPSWPGSQRERAP